MDQIAVTGIRAFGYHGVLPHERQVGQWFVVDLVLALDVTAATDADALNKTVDYGELTAETVRLVEGEPAQLIETLAARIAEYCLTHRLVARAEVTVHKPHAPLPAHAVDVAVTVVREQAAQP